MLHEFYQNLPLVIDPIAFTIGSFAIRWYGIMYLIGFATVYLLLRLRIKKGEFPRAISHQLSVNKNRNQKNNDYSPVIVDNSFVLDFLLVTFLAALVGGRLGYVLFYNAASFFAAPFSIISPFDGEGKFIGIFGMSYHGALVGIIFASYFFLKKNKISFLTWADFVIPAAAAGYFFGRIGNFLNGELYGRITTSLIGMHFSADRIFLRHPSQLYEAVLEGLLIAAVLWRMRNNSLPKGFLFGIYLVCYALIRIFVEQFRQPDSQLGFFWNYFTMGQILSSIMLMGGIFLLTLKNKK